MGTAGRGVTQQEDRQRGLEQPHVFHRLACFLVAITAHLFDWVFGALETPFGTNYGDRSFRDEVLAHSYAGGGFGSAQCCHCEDALPANAMMYLPSGG